MELTLRIILLSPPPGIDFGLQKGSGSEYETVQTQRSGSGDLNFEFRVEVKGGNLKETFPDFRGPFVQGPLNGRFVYIDIGALAGQKDQLSWRLKVPLTGISREIIERINAAPQSWLETKVPGTNKKGGPNCATVKPFAGWEIKTFPRLT